MDERKLLEAAAQAAGLVIGEINGEFYELHRGEMHAKWSPLTDDGAALRLHVAVGMVIGCDDMYAWVESPSSVIIPFGDDPNAAMRLAIVRAAAAKKLAEVLDFPWDHMPTKGRENMRRDARDLFKIFAGIEPNKAEGA
jgi:hypothetical protein